MVTKSKTSTENNNPSRYFWADVTRVTAILLVVLIHSFEIGPITNDASFVSLLLFLIAKSAVPLFIMLSGALLLGKKEPETVFFTKRLKRVLTPWLFWSGVILILTGSVIVSSPLKTITAFKTVFVAEFSFLPALFCLYLLIPIFRQLVQKVEKKYIWYLVGLWFIGVSLLPFVRNSLAFPVSVDNGLVRQTVEYSGYLLLGWLLVTTKIRVMTTVGALYLWLTSLIGTLILVQPRADELQLVFTSYVAPLIVFMSVAGFFLLFKLNQLVPSTSNSELRRLFAVCSKASFGVFLIHTLVLDFLRKDQKIESYPQLLNNLILWISATGLSFIIILMARRVRFLGKIVS